MRRYCGKHKNYDRCPACEREQFAREAVSVAFNTVMASPASPNESLLADALKALADIVLEEEE